MNKKNMQVRYIVDESGEKKEAVLSIELFEKIMEKIDEMYLAQEAEEALKHGEFIDFVEANKEFLKK